MTDTPILPPIAFRWGKLWFRFKTVTEAVDGIGRMLRLIDDASPEGQRLVSCRNILLEYDDTAALNLPDSERALLVETLQLLGTVHEKRTDNGS
jgi:hypothetical protein